MDVEDGQASLLMTTMRLNVYKVIVAVCAVWNLCCAQDSKKAVISSLLTNLKGLHPVKLTYDVESIGGKFRVEHLRKDGVDIFRKYRQYNKGEFELKEILLVKKEVIKYFHADNLLTVTTDPRKLHNMWAFYRQNPIYCVPAVLGASWNLTKDISDETVDLTHLTKICENIKVIETHKGSDLSLKRVQLSRSTPAGEAKSEFVFEPSYQIPGVGMVPLGFTYRMNGKDFVKVRLNRDNSHGLDASPSEKIFTIPKELVSEIRDLDIGINTQVKFKKMKN